MSLWRFVVCFSLICCMVSGQDTIYKPVGGEVDIPGFSNKEPPTDILWKRVEGHNVHKVVHFDGSEEKSFGSFEDRVTLDWLSANLFISDLRYGDSGFYDLEILTNNQHMTKRYKLIVIDKVTKPTISCEINNASTSESTGKATLLCSLPTHSDQSSLELQWSTNGQINLGHVLKISLGGELDDHQYNCTVKNQLTQESAVFTAKDCYPEPKAQAGLIAGVVVLVVLLLIIPLLLFICHKKVRSKKSDLESHSKPGYLNVAASGSEETQVLLDRAPTFPSKHILGHLKQINDAPLNPPHKDEAHMKERRENIRRRSSSDSEKPYDLTVKQRCKIFEKENGKANETEPRKVVEKEVLENNPSDSEAMNPELTASSSEHSSGFSSPPAVSLHLDHPCSDDEKSGDEEKRPDILENNPVEAEKTEGALTGALNGNNCYKKATENTNPEDKRPVSNDPSDSGNPDEVPENQNIWNKENNPVDAEETKDALTGALNGNNGYKKATENTNPEDKRPVSNDPSDSGNPDEVPENQNSEKPYDLPVKQRCKIFEKENGKANEAEPREVVEEEVLANDPSDPEAMNPELTALSSESNSGSKKEENEFEKSTPENDVQPPPVARESSPLSQNSPESAPEAERKQDINSDECAKESNGESSSSSSEESENEEQAPPASAARETDSETTVDEKSLSETASEMETLQNK